MSWDDFSGQGENVGFDRIDLAASRLEGLRCVSVIYPNHEVLQFEFSQSSSPDTYRGLPIGEFTLLVNRPWWLFYFEERQIEVGPHSPIDEIYDRIKSLEGQRVERAIVSTDLTLELQWSTRAFWASCETVDWPCWELLIGGEGDIVYQAYKHGWRVGPAQIVESLDVIPARWRTRPALGSDDEN